MGFSETDSSKCRKHPNPKPLPGVCPSCLRERLSQLSTTTSSKTTNTTSSSVFSNNSSLSSSTPPYSSASASSSSTTARTRHRRNGSEVPVYVSVGMVLNTGLKKSRSVSCAPLSCRSIREKITTADGKINNNSNHNIKNNNIDNSNEKEGSCKMKKKLGGGFLKKLIHTTSKKTKGALMQSKTMRERSSHTTSAAHN